MACKVFVLNYGCTVNRAEGEAMSGVLANQGFSLVNNEEEADVIVVNTCGVKTPTENKILHRLRIIKEGKRVVVTGCLPKIIGVDKIMEARRVEGVLGPAAGKEILKAVQTVLGGGSYVKLNGNSFSLLPCVRENPVIGKIVISQGCLGSCSYCATRFARGRLRSYSIEEVAVAVRKHVEEGARELWLSSQDNSVYGLDIGSDITELLDEVSRVEGVFLTRIGMMNPSGALKHLDGLSEIIKKRGFFKFVHVPLQSGSNRVLRDMNRNYTVEDFIEVASRFRREVPKVSIETDVIVGYPTERDEDFEETVKVVGNVKPDFLNISKFYPRPGAPASRLPRLPTQVVSARSRSISKLALEIKEERNMTWVGWEGLALVDEMGIVPNSVISRNVYYKPIVLRRPVKLGSFIRVRVESCRPNFLVGEVVEENLGEEEAFSLLKN